MPCRLLLSRSFSSACSLPCRRFFQCRWIDEYVTVFGMFAGNVLQWLWTHCAHWTMQPWVYMPVGISESQHKRARLASGRESKPRSHRWQFDMCRRLLLRFWKCLFCKLSCRHLQKHFSSAVDFGLPSMQSWQILRHRIQCYGHLSPGILLHRCCIGTIAVPSWNLWHGYRLACRV